MNIRINQIPEFISIKSDISFLQISNKGLDTFFWAGRDRMYTVNTWITYRRIKPTKFYSL